MTAAVAPPAAPASPEDGAELLRKLRIALARTRSVQIESSGETATRWLSPEIMPDSLLNGALQRLDGRTPTWGTLNNILSLAHRSDLVVLGYALHWSEDLPRQHSFPLYAGGDT